MMEKKKLPVGIEFFDELIKENFYYVDKTDMLTELLEDWGKVNLFTRPRRFGKSLNMRMMQSFFEIGADPYLFEGLKISKERTLCEKYMGNHLRSDSEAWPEDYWSNSSGNDIVRRFIDKADIQTRNEIEQLIACKAIEKELRQELTYNELDSTIENLWSVLFTTGYLTQRGRTEGRRFLLAIPNREIRELFISQIREWFKESVRKDRPRLDAFCMAFLNRDSDTIQKLFSDYLWTTISIRDTAAASEYKENFYHGILLGLFGFMENWLIQSNAESGIGYSDILIEVPQSRTGIAIELKYAENGDMAAACQKALDQIEEKKYTARLKEDGMRSIIQYGIACYKKDCEVKVC